jgi:hypothetical protein
MYQISTIPSYSIMQERQKCNARLQSYLQDIRNTVNLIKSRDLVMHNFPSSKQDIYTHLVARLEYHLDELEFAVTKRDNATSWTRFQKWCAGYDIEKKVLELRFQSIGFWEQLNRASRAGSE